MGSAQRKPSFFDTQICCGGQLHQPDELRLANTAQPPVVYSDSTAATAHVTSSVVLDLTSEERLQRLKEAVHYAKLLVLRVVSSKVVPSDLQITINALGVEEGSKRDAKDGVVYFGNKRRVKKGGEVVNDVKIPANDADLCEKHRGRHFQVAYDPFSEKYYIRDLSIGFGAFVKLDCPLLLKENHLLHVGESFVMANLLETSSGGRIRLKLFGGPCTGEVFYFEAREYCAKALRLGRMASCEIQIEDSLISKCQCSVKFERELGWILTDGDCNSGRSSTNGTW